MHLKIVFLNSVLNCFGADYRQAKEKITHAMDLVTGNDDGIGLQKPDGLYCGIDDVSKKNAAILAGYFGMVITSRTADFDFPTKRRRNNEYIDDLEGKLKNGHHLIPGTGPEATMIVAVNEIVLTAFVKKTCGVEIRPQQGEPVLVEYQHSDAGEKWSCVTFTMNGP